MGYTKRQLVEQALEEIGLSPFTFPLTTEQMNSALRRLDSMMAEWNAMGIRLGYSIPASPNLSSLDEASGVPDSSWEAIITNLAIRISASYGKQLMPQTLSVAKEAFNVLLSRATAPLEQDLPSTMPYGAGNKPWRDYGSPFFSEPVEPLTTGPEGPLVLE